ncbi:hypothetical protein B0H63DRAFT_454520 [Podospora didyma]|uniref:Uncharacterized protein n=1 Tax=Podospora didyma TaxID=330526 RepID=A0AAE0K5M9_9PEZI|nr:hypothetical protein B0H63DRAFT_454520 [Podospora didyma]
MKFSKTIFALAAMLGNFAAAAPAVEAAAAAAAAPTEVAVLKAVHVDIPGEPAPEALVLVEKRAPAPATIAARGTVSVTMYSGDVCNGSNQSVFITNGGYRCEPVSAPRRSLSVSGSGCSVTTWSGTNCQGSSFNIPFTGCWSILYGSVSIQC